MSEAGQLHREAMHLAERASAAKADQGEAAAIPLLREALEKERAAAETFEPDRQTEPTRSVLYRSAASLALDCGEFREAERLAAAGLGGHPPAEITEELRDLLDQVHFRESLKRRGLVLDDQEFNVSLLGDAVGTGIAESAEFILRAVDLDKLIYRTAERTSGRPYRQAGARKRRLASQVGTFVSAPQAGSFSVTFRIGYPEQMDLPGLGLAQAVIDELFECFQLFEDSQTAQLRERIGDEDYYRNFVGLAKEIAPDGDAVRSVGLKRTREGEERQVLLTRTRAAVAPAEPAVIEAPASQQRVEIRGVLKFASRMKEDAPEIRVIGESGRKYSVLVPLGLMDDIVRPLWDCEVVVSGRRAGKKILLDDIRPAEAEN